MQKPSDRELADEVLVAQAQQELPYSSAAFTKLVRRYNKLVHRIIFGVVQDATALDDLSQDVFVSVFKQIHTFEGRSSFKTWLCVIATRRSIDYLRSKHQSQEFISLSQEDTEELNLQQPETDIESNQSFIRMISTLNELERQIVTLRFVAELEFNEISAIVDLKVSAVKMRFYRALEKIKDAIGTSRLE